MIQSIIGNKEKVFEIVQKQFMSRYHIKWLKPIGFNNAYALMMRKKQAADLKIQTISQLKMYIDNN
jgi:osmoprotectant transport system permease protein